MKLKPKSNLQNRSVGISGAIPGIIVALVPSTLFATNLESEVFRQLSPELCPEKAMQTGYGCNDGNSICCWTKDIIRNYIDRTQKSYIFRNKVQPGIYDGDPTVGSGWLAIGGPGGGD